MLFLALDKEIERLQQQQTAQVRRDSALQLDPVNRSLLMDCVAFEHITQLEWRRKSTTAASIDLENFINDSRIVMASKDVRVLHKSLLAY